MSDRKLVLLPWIFALVYGLLPFGPSPRPIPKGLDFCTTCSTPIWLSEPVHPLVLLPLMVLLVLGLIKLSYVLMTGELSAHFVFRILTPFLWVVFFTVVAFYLGQAYSYPPTKPVPYDYTALIPLGLFAVTDFVFVKRIRMHRRIIKQLFARGW
jgi:hypothetical protein